MVHDGSSFFSFFSDSVVGVFEVMCTHSLTHSLTRDWISIPVKIGELKAEYVRGLSYRCTPRLAVMLCCVLHDQSNEMVKAA